MDRKKMARKVIDSFQFVNKWVPSDVKTLHTPETKKMDAPFAKDGEIIENLSTGKKMKVKFKGKEMEFIPLA
jgi:hypothetical protein